MFTHDDRNPERPRPDERPGARETPPHTPDTGLSRASLPKIPESSTGRNRSDNPVPKREGMFSVLKNRFSRLRLFLIERFPNLYPPFLGAGIKIHSFNPSENRIDVRMKLSFFNKNYNGSHFGGSLFSMTDPFYAMILIKKLGPAYIVWDKEATIRFKKPGLGLVTASFIIPQEEIERIKSVVDTQGKMEPKFTAKILNQNGETVAEVDKVLYVKRRAGK